MRTRLAFLLALTLAAATLLGCSKTPQVPVNTAPAGTPTASTSPTSASTPASEPASAAPSPHAGTADSTQPSGALREMSKMNKLGAINAGFPVEYPVADGKVVDSEAPTATMLRFVVDVAAPVADVEAWYRRTMKDRQFVLSREGVASGGAAELRYTRATIVYTLEFRPTSPSDCEVVGTVSEP